MHCFDFTRPAHKEAARNGVLIDGITLAGLIIKWIRAEKARDIAFEDLVSRTHL